MQKEFSLSQKEEDYPTEKQAKNTDNYFEQDWTGQLVEKMLNLFRET